MVVVLFFFLLFLLLFSCLGTAVRDANRNQPHNKWITFEPSKWKQYEINRSVFSYRMMDLFRALLTFLLLKLKLMKYKDYHLSVTLSRLTWLRLRIIGVSILCDSIDADGMQNVGISCVLSYGKWNQLFICTYFYAISALYAIDYANKGLPLTVWTIICRLFEGRKSIVLINQNGGHTQTLSSQNVQLES